MFTNMIAAAVLPLTLFPAAAETINHDGMSTISITVGDTKINVTAPGNGKPVITTVDGETITPTPSVTPSAAPTPAADDDPQDGENGDQGPAQDAPSDTEAIADRIFEETNKFRAEHGLDPFERDTCLDGTAAKKSQLLVDTGVFEHGDLGPASEECKTSIGENIAYVTPADAETVARELVYDIWATSTEGHREAMLSTEYDRMGVGAADNGDGFHATQHFS